MQMIHSVSPSIDIAYPSVDVIIPTFNASRTLGRCLESVLKQKYPGKINIIVVDGGSSDNTVSIAHDFGIPVLNFIGSYLAGLDGARHFGEKVTSSDYVWYVDSDDIMVEETVLEDLITPMMNDISINLSLPQIAYSITDSGLNNWLSAMESMNVESTKRKGISIGSSVILEDISYGLTNGALLRRSVLNAAGGYDSDFRLLRRIRKLKLSKGIVIGSAHYYHEQTAGMRDFFLKWSKRINRYGQMDDEKLSKYFYEWPTSKADHHDNVYGTVIGPLNYAYLSVIHFIRMRQAFWLWSLVYLSLLIGIVLKNPINSYRSLARFL